jgi:hypothetical protein
MGNALAEEGNWVDITPSGVSPANDSLYIHASHGSEIGGT